MHTRARREEAGAIKKELVRHGVVLLGFVAVIWLVELLDLALCGGGMDAFGIRPRTLSGLVGIPLAPFLHAGFGHVLSNTWPFLVLGWLVMLRETWHFFAVAGITTLLGGLGVWLTGAPHSVHIGASGLVFGLFGFLLLTGWFERKLGTILISVAVFVVYGGLLFGVLPGRAGVSWQSHLFGFLAGVLAAKLLARRKTAKQDS